MPKIIKVTPAVARQLATMMITEPAALAHMLQQIQQAEEAGQTEVEANMRDDFYEQLDAEARRRRQTHNQVLTAFFASLPRDGATRRTKH